MQTTGSRGDWSKPGLSHPRRSPGIQRPSTTVWQPVIGRNSPALMKAANSARVTSNLASPNGLAMTRSWRGNSWAAFSAGTSKRCCSAAVDPISKRPAGITTISGQFGQSRKVAGFAPPAWAATEAVAAVAGVDGGGGAAARGAGCPAGDGAGGGCGAGDGAGGNGEGNGGPPATPGCGSSRQ